MNESRPNGQSGDTVAWGCLVASVLLPLLCSFLLFSAALPLGRKGGSATAQIFALVEVATIVGGIVGFASDSESSKTGRTFRLIITIVAGGVGVIWLVGLSGFAGMGP
jgi:hypothetical protein